ncbi:MAG TPA: hypothetical protein VE422_15425 [Terriglobia bacterium]|nr:hypothetical protein [Terriglobia bacterium]
MKKLFGLILLAGATSAPFQVRQSPQVWSGRLSDSMCGASHQMKAAAGNMSERDCLFECIKALAKYVLVDEKQQIIPVANQDLGGFPLYAGRLVRITGELKDGEIVATKIEAIPAHLHLGHVMTNWTDTPASVGFLIAAVSEGRVAASHADLAAKTPDDLDAMKLHAGHVLNALDPGIEPKGPGAGYGVRKAAAGALQHLELAVMAEGASPNIKTHAPAVSASLNDVLRLMNQAIGSAQKIRSATSAAEAAPLVRELAMLTKEISDGGLQQARARMDLMMKGEGLENAPR